jgi:hypothetical protein
VPSVFKAQLRSPLNLAATGSYRSVSLVAGGCHESSCDTLLQPLILIGFWLVEVIQHHVVDAYNLSMASARCCELLVLQVFGRYQLVSAFFRDTPDSMALILCLILSWSCCELAPP